MERDLDKWYNKTVSFMSEVSKLYTYLQTIYLSSWKDLAGKFGWITRIRY